MERLLEFAANHPLLTFAVLGLSGAIAGYEIQRWRRRGWEVGPVEATRLVNDEDAVVLDVRGEAEYAEGHLPGARHVPLRELDGRLRELEKLRERPIIAYCRSGNTSLAACRTLRRAGFARAYSLAGGVRAWQEAGLPLTRERARGETGGRKKRKGT